MKKVLYMAALMICSASAIAQNATNSVGKKEGKWSGYFESNNLRYIGEFRDGKEVGVFTYYEDAPEQKIKATRDFSKEAGKSYAVFYMDGKKISEGWYKGKAKEGKWLYYHKGGSVINSEETYLNDQLEGEKKVFYISGKLSDVIPYKNGKIHGKVFMYSESGTVLKEEDYANGMRNGMSSYYDGSGKLIKKGNFVDDVLQGKWIES